MVVPYTQATQNNNKCPHGFPIGACPICSGMGASGSKDKNKPRRAGEMSYNECLAQWHRMQRADALKKQEKSDLINIRNNQEILKNFQKQILKIQQQLSILNDKTNNMPLIIKPVIKTIANIGLLVVNFISKIPNAIRNIQEFYNNITNFLMSVSEKLSSLLGEIKSFIQESNFINKAKKKIKTLLSLFSEGNNENEEENEEIEKLKLKEIKKFFKIIFKKEHKEKKLEKDENAII